ncbi:MAG TPA: glycosyltransferase family 4 protein [Azospirillaceae bacterium]|nr:glycosyltransferase family 4 protein [Azospirillaceae bacterium]
MNASMFGALLHRHVWQRLPRDSRREAAVRVAALLAPRPSLDPIPAAGPIIVAGYLRAATGLGQSARLCLEALRSAGLPAYGYDLSGPFRQGKAIDVDGLADPQADFAGPGALILHVNAPFVPMALRLLPRRWIRGKLVVGYWAWELPGLPALWRVGAPFVHEVWTPSRFVSSAVSADLPELPVHTVAHPVALRAPAAKVPSEDGRLRVLTMLNIASSFARKNPLAAVAAFREAFGKDPSCHLTIKVQNGAAYPEGHRRLLETVADMPNVTVDERTLAPGEVVAMVARHDVLLSLHRSEGFGLHLAEAMLAGLVVVATDWSGSTDFIRPDWAMPVPYRLVPAADPQGDYDQSELRWAEADVGAAAEALRGLRDPAVRAPLGRRAQAEAQAMFSASAYAARVRALLGR